MVGIYGTSALSASESQRPRMTLDCFSQPQTTTRLPATSSLHQRQRRHRNGSMGIVLPPRNMLSQSSMFFHVIHRSTSGQLARTRTRRAHHFRSATDTKPEYIDDANGALRDVPPRHQREDTSNSSITNCTRNFAIKLVLAWLASRSVSRRLQGFLCRGRDGDDRLLGHAEDFAFALSTALLQPMKCETMFTGPR